jgi:hypothetical protein
VSFLRRRKFIVNYKLQLSILLTSLGYVGFLILVVSVALFAPLILRLRHPDYNSIETSDAALRILYLHDTYWLPVLLTLVAIALHSVSISHKIAGPIYRLRRICEAMIAGVLPKPVVLRKGDYLRPEMDAANGMLDAWRGLIAGAQRDATTLHESLSRYRELSTTAHTDVAADDLWNAIVRTEQQLHDTLGRVKCEV